MVQTNYYKMKRLFVSLFAFSLLFISCESDSETLNSSTVKVESTTAVSARTSNFEENLDLFAINHIKISDEISNLINQNENVDLSNIPYESLENSRNEFDLKTDLENAGVINADLLIVALKKQVENFNIYLANDKDFINLDTTKRNEVVVNAIERNLSEIQNTSSILNRRTCKQQWDVDVSRCNRNYYWAGGLAVVATFATGGWGLLGVVGAVAGYRDCLSDALDDFRACS